MNETDPSSESPMAIALDKALARSLAAPAVPADFRRRLMAVVARSSTVDARQARAALEAEHAQQLSELRVGYVRLQRRTLGTLIGAAFATGVAVTIAMPWIREHFGANAVFAVPALGAVIGVAIGGYSWVRRSALAPLLDK